MSQCSKTTKDGKVQCRGSEGHAGPCFLGSVTLADFDRSAEEAQREKDADLEAARWQKRIAETIESHGLEPADASGCDSGDPLDWTDTQVHAALFAITEKQEAVSERFELFLAMAEDVAEGRRPAKDLTEAIAQERVLLGVACLLLA
jgi:hypothetical protein